jgi:hypothetical protein
MNDEESTVEVIEDVLDDGRVVGGLEEDVDVDMREEHGGYKQQKSVSEVKRKTGNVGLQT